MQMFDKYKREQIQRNLPAKVITKLQEAEWKKQGFKKINFYSGKRIIKSSKSKPFGFADGFSELGTDNYFDPPSGYCLKQERTTIFKCQELEFYENYKTGEIRVVLNNMHETEGHTTNKDVIISLSEQEIRKYGSSLEKAITDKISKMNYIFGSNSELLTGEDSSDGYDISVKQILIQDNQIYQPVDKETFFEVADINDYKYSKELFGRGVYLVSGEQLNSYKPEDFLKGIERLKISAENEYYIIHIKQLLSLCINNLNKNKIRFVEIGPATTEGGYNINYYVCKNILDEDNIKPLRYVSCNRLFDNRGMNDFYNNQQPHANYNTRRSPQNYYYNNNNLPNIYNNNYNYQNQNYRPINNVGVKERFKITGQNIFNKYNY